MRILFICLAIYSALIIFGGLASAQETQGDSAKIIGEWNITPVSTESGECVMSAKFDNGLKLAFKGQENKLTAIRLGNLPKQNMDQAAGFIGFGLDDNSYALQSRSQKGQIDANLTTVSDAAEGIMNLPVFRVRIDDEDYYFSSKGFDAGYESLIACQNGKMSPKVRVADRLLNSVIGQNERETINVNDLPERPVYLFKGDDVEVVKPMVMDEPIEGSQEMALLPLEFEAKEEKPAVKMDDIEWVAEAAQTAGLKAQVVNTGGEPIMEGHKWSASKGAFLQSVLKRWSKTAGVNAQIELDKDPMLGRDFIAISSFGVAVNALLRDVAENEPGVMDGTPSAPHISHVDEEVVIADVSAGMMPNRWRALQGTDLRHVLKRWSVEQGIDFVWDTNQRFYIPQSVKVTTDYVEAVTTLLAQFEGQPVQPKATLNTDPNTGRKALIIQSAKTS